MTAKKNDIKFKMKILLKYIQSYGLKNLFIIIIYELIYIVMYSDCSIFRLNKNFNISSKNSKKYNSVYFPSTFYALNIIRKNTNLNNNNSILLDFGSGDGRPGKVFNKLKYYGFDYDPQFFQNTKKIKIFNINLRDFQKLKNLLKKLKLRKKIIYLYFNDPFENELVFKLIRIFYKKFKNIKLIFVNNSNIDYLLKKNISIDYKKVFRSNKKNIYIGNIL
jgi:hypothetical protein